MEILFNDPPALAQEICHIFMHNFAAEKVGNQNTDRKREWERAKEGRFVYPILHPVSELSGILYKPYSQAWERK